MRCACTTSCMSMNYGHLHVNLHLDYRHLHRSTGGVLRRFKSHQLHFNYGHSHVSFHINYYICKSQTHSVEMFRGGLCGRAYPVVDPTDQNEKW